MQSFNHWLAHVSDLVIELVHALWSLLDLILLSLLLHVDVLVLGGTRETAKPSTLLLRGLFLLLLIREILLLLPSFLLIVFLQLMELVFVDAVVVRQLLLLLIWLVFGEHD